MNQKSPLLLAEQFISFVKTVYPAGLTKEQHEMAAWMFFAGAKSHERALSAALQQGGPVGAAMVYGLKEETNQSPQSKIDSTASVIAGEPDTFEAALARIGNEWLRRGADRNEMSLDSEQLTIDLRRGESELPCNIDGML